MVYLFFFTSGRGQGKLNNFRYKVALTNIVIGPLMFDVTLLIWELHKFEVGDIERRLLSSWWIIGVVWAIVPKLRSESD